MKIKNKPHHIIREMFETYCDERGEIKKIAQNVDVLNISSKKNSKRAAHYHKSSSHLCKLLSGKMLYYERKALSKDLPIKLEINPGQYFYTGPKIEHLMVFLEDSIFDCYSFGSRSQNKYEEDLVRIDWDLQDIYNQQMELNLNG